MHFVLSPVFQVLDASQQLLAEDTLPAPFSPSLQLVQVARLSGGEQQPQQLHLPGVGDGRGEAWLAA